MKVLGFEFLVLESPGIFCTSKFEFYFATAVGTVLIAEHAGF